MAMSNLYNKIAQKPGKRFADITVSQTNTWVNGKSLKRDLFSSVVVLGVVWSVFVFVSKM